MLLRQRRFKDGRAGDTALRVAGYFVEELIHEFLLAMETRALEAFKCISEVEKTSIGRHGQNGESPRYPETPASGGPYAFPIVH